MPQHALAYVRFDQLRGPGWEKPGNQPVFTARFYSASSPRLHQSVGEGGTLWLVTGIPVKKAPVTYTLAYKLAGCELLSPVEASRRLPEAYLSGKYAVLAHDIHHTYHFSLKLQHRADLTAYIPLLRFTNCKPVTDPRHFPTWLYNFPVLAGESIALLERLERRSRYGREVVISYAREDVELAKMLQERLQEHGLRVYRDLTNLRAGENWREAVQEALEIADALLVLLSPSSNNSPAVHDEVRWALERLSLPGGLTAIIPVLLPGSDFQSVNWERFEISSNCSLKDHNCIQLPLAADDEYFAGLVKQIAEVTKK